MSREINDVRRKNREVTDEEWIHDFLERSRTCVIGTIAEDRAFLNPNLFLYDRAARAIYFHTAGTGRTRTNIEQQPSVTVCVYEIGELVEARRAVEFTMQYASVVAFGRASILQDAASIREVMTRHMRKYAPDLLPGRDFVDFTDEDAARATVYRVDIERWSAKRNAEEAHRISRTGSIDERTSS